MKARKPISRLTKPKVLRAFSRPHLRTILTPHIRFLQDHDLTLPPIERKRGNYDFTKLSKVLCHAPDRPEQLLIDFDKIGTLSDPHGAELLQRQFELNGLPIAENATNHDLAAEAFLTQQHLFATALQQKRLVDTRKFRCFRARKDADLSAPQLDAADMIALEKSLSDWFKASRRGEGCEILSVDPVDNCLWFVIIHGGTRRRTPTFHNKVKSVLDFHPEQDDVLRLDLTNRRIWIHANAPSEINLYRQRVGEFLFGDPATFDHELNLYTMEPLRQAGRASLRTNDITGCPIESIELQELCIVVDPENATVSKYSSQNDLFCAVESGSVVLPPGGFVSSAKFRVKFRGRQEFARVGIRLPATADYENDGHSEWIEAWLKRRGFWLMEEDVTEDSVEVAPDPDASLAEVL